MLFFSIFTFLFVPETKNKSIHEIQDHFEKGWFAVGRKRKIGDSAKIDADVKGDVNAGQDQISESSSADGSEFYETASSNADMYSVTE